MRVNIIHANSLSLTEKEKLAQEMLAIFSINFKQMSVPYLMKKLDDKEHHPVVERYLLNNKILAYCIMLEYHVQYQNHLHIGEAGIMAVDPEYRASISHQSHALFLAIRFRKQILDNENRYYVVGTALNPFYFDTVMNAFEDVYPKYFSDDLFTVSQLLIKNKYGVNITRDKFPPSIKSAISVDLKASKGDLQKKKYTRFYLKQNPNYTEGEGLLFCYPMNVTNLKAMIKFYAEKGINMQQLITNDQENIEKQFIKFMGTENNNEESADELVFLSSRL